MTSKLKRDKWHDRPRSSRLANVMFPHLADKETRAEMEGFARNEGKRLPDPKLLKDPERGSISPLGGTAAWRR